ncbi:MULTISPECIES: hypothetical protein [unclassified Streptomyces]|uniref:hypothetical protein n=1 Tax=unclassified Streptomyces TaxID=2593676 RepID=UPI00037FE3CF|nr:MULTISPECIES: hypothetical protein [unclassified Streptomyces]MYT27552.1 hypothetical protein [Streptomyces sp. SID8354]
MRNKSDTAEFVSDGTRHAVTRAQVEAAASHLPPAHSATFSRNREWYALVGTGLHYVVDLLAEASGTKPSDVKTARLALDALGFPVVCWAWGDLLTVGHSGHRTHTS